jgi:uncharacterized membrane protein
MQELDQSRFQILGSGHLAFAVSLVALGSVGLFYGDFALVWQPVPDTLPGRTVLAYLSALTLIVGGVGILYAATAKVVSRVLLVYLALWLLLLRVPKLIVSPFAESSWAGFGETAIYVAAGLALFARLGIVQRVEQNAVGADDFVSRGARSVYGFALIPCGLAHIVYLKDTADFVPGWLPWHYGWAYGTGAAFVLAGFAILAGVGARVAAILSAIMMGGFTLLVWMPAVFHRPQDRFSWTALLVSSALATSGWVMADMYRTNSDVASARSQSVSTA